MVQHSHTQAPAATPSDCALMTCYVRRFRPAWLADQEEDLVQMALIRVLRAGATIEHRPAYFRRTAQSTVLDEVRRARHRTEVPMTTSVWGRVTDSKDLTPETRARGEQVGRAISHALDHVSEARRHAVKLHLEGHGVSEIALRLDQPRKVTANQVYRGLSDLRLALKAQGIQP